MAKAIKAADASKSDYIALISFGAGGSWIRDPDPEEAVKRVVRLAKSDWKTLFKFKKGATIKVNLNDITGHDHDKIGDDGVFTESGEGDDYKRNWIPRLKLVDATIP